MKTRAGSNVRWIERFCVVPSGPCKGKPVRLSFEDKEAIGRIYRDADSLASEPIGGALAAYLCLLHVCGPEAPGKGPVPDLHTDPWTVWAAAGPRALAVIRREGEAVVCPELATAWPRRAA